MHDLPGESRHRPTTTPWGRSSNCFWSSSVGASGRLSRRLSLAIRSWPLRFASGSRRWSSSSSSVIRPPASTRTPGVSVTMIKPGMKTCRPTGWVTIGCCDRLRGGGMGVVYEAEHESLKSRVALKVMHPRFRADPKYLRRFQVEARLAAGLHHTNIVTVFDYGAQDGVCYYAMQFIQGQPLDRILADIRRLQDDDTNAEPDRARAGIVTMPAAVGSAAVAGIADRPLCFDDRVHHNPPFDR